jgi:hypothetical protein
MSTVRDRQDGRRIWCVTVALARRGASRLVANVPIGTDVELNSSSGDIRLIGCLGVVRVHTASGDIEVGDAARLDVATASGGLRCGEIAGQVSISSVSGDCMLERVGGSVEATLTSGDLRIDRCDGDLTVNSTSDVRVGRCGGSDIAVRSISGDVRIGLPSVSASRPRSRPSVGERRCRTRAVIERSTAVRCEWS